MASLSSAEMDLWMAWSCLSFRTALMVCFLCLIVAAVAAESTPEPEAAVVLQRLPNRRVEDLLTGVPSGEGDFYCLPEPTIFSLVPPGVWGWELMPDGLIYHSYLASPKAPRISGAALHQTHREWLLDVTLGGRVGIVRYGTANNLWPEGWQLDIEGAAFPRLNLDHNWDMDSADFRFGVPLTYGVGNVRVKFAYCHQSSHLGDELIARIPSLLSSRINYSRDALLWGISYYPSNAWRFYGESSWAFYNDGGSRPWEFQFGVEYSPLCPTGIDGVPFFAINASLREAVSFGGNLVVQTGVQWRGASGHRLRTGFDYFNGKSSQYQFFTESEQQLGLGIWYDY